MNNAFYIAATGLRAQESALQVHANNISNMNTPGFKRAEMSFAELVAQRGEPAANAAAAAQSLAGVLMGVHAQETTRTFEQGDLRRTANPLDLAIDGQGFLEVLGPEGRTFLTRGGTLKIDAEGQLATAQGWTLKAGITAPQDATALTIDPQGNVSAEGPEGARIIGRIEMVTVRDPSALRALGDGLYEAEDPRLVTSASAGLDGAGLFVQGSLEGSNVKLADEMVTLLLMQRGFAANAQVIQAADQLMALSNGLMR